MNAYTYIITNYLIPPYYMHTPEELRGSGLGVKWRGVERSSEITSHFLLCNEVFKQFPFDWVGPFSPNF